MSSSTGQLRIVLIGKTGNGKSSTGNSLLHSLTTFHSTQSAKSITKDCQAGTAQYTDESGSIKKILVVDTPGFFDTDTSISNQMVQGKITSQIFPMTSPGVHAFLIILRIDRFTPEEKTTVDFIKTIFGEGAAKYCIVIFTRADQLEEGQTLDEFIHSSSELRQFVNVCGNRKLAFNNKLAGQPLKRKIQELLKMIQEMVNNNNGTYYTNAEYQRIEQQRREEQRRREQEEIARKKAYEEALVAKTREDERRRADELAQKARDEERQIAQRRIKEAEQARRQAEEARCRVEEQARRDAEEARRRVEEQARRDAEDAQRRIAEQARRDAEDARRRVEEQARRDAENAQRRMEEQARRDAEMARMQSMRFESQPAYCCPTPTVYSNNNGSYDPLGQLLSQMHIGSATGPRNPMNSMNTGSNMPFVQTRPSSVEMSDRHGGRFTGEHMVTRGAANGRPIYEGGRGKLYYETPGGNRTYLRK